MLKAFLLAQIAKMERAWGYDARYLRLMARVSPASTFKFGMVGLMVDDKAAPPEVIAAAKLVGTLAEDCGPCTQIVTDMGLAAGADPEILKAILAGDEAAMGEDAALAWRFCRASLARDIEAADPLRDEVVRRWGEAGLVAVGLALASGRMYPTVKYALGYGKACSRVTVAGQPTPVAHLAEAA